MHPPPASAKRSFFERANDRDNRDLPSRLSRFARAKLRAWAGFCQSLADDPRVLKARARGWDAAHFINLTRWRDEGFRPKVVYDIGGHDGLWSEMCQGVLSPAKCFLFEPQRQFQEKAKARQLRLNANWEIVPVALGDRNEIDLLHVTQNAAASSLLAPIQDERSAPADTRATGEEKVRVASLDNLAAAQSLPPPDLVKIDVQGYEGRVLVGGRATLSRAQRIIIEVSLRPLYSGQSLMPEILQSLAEWGFELDDLQEAFRQWPGPLWQVDLWLKRKV
jgi:FkbM family methyltransferase